MRLLEEQNSRAAESDKRAAAKSEIELKALRDSQAEWDANAPVRDATRKSSLLEQQNKLSDQTTTANIKNIGENAKTDYDTATSKSVMVGKDEAGNPTYTVEGEKANSEEEARQIYQRKHPFATYFRQNRLPGMVEELIKSGRIADAGALEKWANDDRTTKGIEASGKVIESLSIGDIKGVNKHLNDIMSDRNYLVKDGYDINSELIKGENGEQGLRLSYKNKQTGESFSQDMIGTESIVNGLQGLVDPRAHFELNKHAVEAARTQRAKAAEKGIDMSSDVIKKASEQAIEYRKDLDDPIKYPFAKDWKPEQKDKYVKDRFETLVGQHKPASQPPAKGIPTATWGPGR